MKVKQARIGIAIFLAVFIFVFLVPIVPYKIPAVCPLDSHCVSMPPRTYYTGYRSLGLVIFQWGSSWLSGAQWFYYLPLPSAMIGVEASLDRLTGGLGGLLLSVLPVSLLAAALIIPEIVSGMRHRKSRHGAHPQEQMEMSVPKRE